MSKALHGDYAFLSDAGHFSFADQSERWILTFNRWLRKKGFVASRSQGCGRAAAPSTCGQPLAQELGGRRYFLQLPPAYERDHAHALVVSFHGLMSQPSDAPFFKDSQRFSENVIFELPRQIRS